VAVGSHSFGGGITPIGWGWWLLVATPPPFAFSFFFFK